mmetsp:Transcript_9323/g.19302  ORF Transcript_9323/g.19302 Transcript_9323/m.19302 type:complete len:339 (+) Transcript_9323:137-1153(+)
MPCDQTYTSLKTRTPWRWPWILLTVAIYAFCLPWMASAIFQRYYIEKDYDATLPGLDDTAARKFFMASHMGLGAICLILYPLQFTAVVRRRWPSFHRWTGRVAVCASMLCSLCGMVFTCLKRFKLVGGLNMGISFFTAGVVFALCAGMTAKHARNRDFLRHRNWAIRSFSQVLAPPLYRYYYLVLGGMGALPDDGDDYCNEDDVCDIFLRTFDAVHAWTYFIFPLVCAELVVYLLMKQEKMIYPTSKSEAALSVTIENSQNIVVVKENVVKDGMINEEVEDNNDLDECPADISTLEPSAPNPNYLLLNLLGLLAGMLYLVMTVFIYVTSALGVNQVET